MLVYIFLFKLICLIYFNYFLGIPSIVTWWKDSYLLDDSFVSMPRGIVRNELTFSYLDRGELMSTLTCQAATNATEPAEKSVSVDMNCKIF